MATVKKNDIAISVKDVNKAFKLPHEKQSSIKGLVVNIFRGSRTYETQKVLNDISFDIKKGEFFGIIGRNGSGKSTLLKLISQIYTPDSGSIEVKGKLTPFIELGVGFNPELTGRENVFLNGALLGFSRKEMEAMYAEIVEFAELERFMDQKLKNYSSGMQVRLAFSIAIKADTEILILDEVLAVGDTNFQKKCFEYFKKLKRNKKTVVLVTHDMGAAREFCERAILLNNGEIVPSGDIEDTLDKYMDIMDPGRTKDRSSQGDEPANKEKGAKISKSVEVSDSSIDIEVHIDNKNVPAQDVGVAVCIKDTINVAAMKYNSLYDDQKTFYPLRQGQNTVRLKFHNFLVEGRYFVDFALVDQKGEKVIGEDNLIRFRVNNGKKNIIKTKLIKSIEVG